MSAPMALPDAAPMSPSQRILVRTIVLLARALVRLRPETGRTVMTRLARGAAPATRAAIERAHAEVTSVNAYCAGWQGCLVRSTAVCLLCRVRGEWPTWVVGVRVTLPFAAHCWVEHNEEMIGELGPRSAFRSLYAIGPGDRTGKQSSAAARSWGAARGGRGRASRGKTRRAPGGRGPR